MDSLIEILEKNIQDLLELKKDKIDKRELVSVINNEISIVYMRMSELI